MENKTCGECKYYNDAMLHCEKFDCMAEDSWSCPACEEKEKPKPTNGDVIRQMSNKELAEIINNVDCKKCPAYMTCFDGKKKTCFDGFLDWLNAPAESEVGDE